MFVESGGGVGKDGTFVESDARASTFLSQAPRS